MFPPRHRETKGKCVVEAKGGFRGFGELRPVSMAGSSWQKSKARTWISHN